MIGASLDFTSVIIAEVSRHFGRRRALAKVSATLEAGQVTGLLGPNGAGKSTLLAILATLAAPSTGEVRYGSVTARDGGPAVRARMGVLAHELHLYPELTARENLVFFGRLYGLQDAEARAAEALTRAGLSERANDLVVGFSRGMRQRLALERALLHGPRLLLLDEPFTGLDDASARMLVERLAGLRADGAIVLVTTHDLDLVDGLLDQAIILRDGRLLDVQRPVRNLREHYRRLVGRGAPS